MNHNDSITIPTLTAERTGPGRYVVRTHRGAELRVGSLNHGVECVTDVGHERAPD